MIVGRADELAALRDLCLLAGSGAGGCLLVEGDAGAGKSALLRAVARESHGLRVVWGRAPEEGGAPALWVWREVADHCGWQVDWDGAPDAWTLAASLAREATSAARVEPLLLLLDDLHAADEDSLRLAAYLAKVLADHPVALVAAARPDPRLDRVARHGRRLLLGPLDPPSAAALIDRNAPRSLSPSERRRIQAVAEGNPLVLQELARTAGAGELPGEVRASVLQRMSPLDAAAVELLSVAAVLGRRFDVVVLSAVLDQPQGAVLAGLDLVRRLGLADGDGHRWSFSHGVIRAVVYDAMPLAGRLRAHQRAAEVLADRDASAAVAAHLLAAVPLVEPARAVAAVRAAARDASASAAHAERAELLAKAVDLVPAEEERTALLLELGDACLRSGQTARAGDSFQQAMVLARSHADWSSHARGALGLTERLMTEGAALERLPELVIAVQEIRAQGDQALLSELLARCSQLRSHEPTAGAGLADAEEAVRLARACAEPRLLAQALLALHVCFWMPGRERDAAEVSLELVRVAYASGDYDLQLEAEIARMVDGLRSGDLRVVDVALERAAAVAERSGSPRHDYFVLTRRAMRAVVAGRMGDASHLLRRAWDIGLAIEEPDALQVHWGAQFLVLSELSSREQIVEMADQLREWAARESDLLPVLANMLAAVGHVDDAHQALAGYVAGKDPMQVLPGQSLAWGVLMANAAVTVEDPQLAGIIEQALAPYAGSYVVNAGAVTFGGVIEHWLGALQLVQGREREGRASLHAARDAYLRMGTPLFVSMVDALLAPGRDRVSSTAREAALRQVEHGWSVGWVGQEVELPDVRGLHHLHALLTAAGQEVHVLDLAGGGAAAVLSGHARQPVLDDEAKRAYRARVTELQNRVVELEDAGDEQAAADAAAELEALLTELRRAVGLGGRDRWHADETERARVAVRKAVTSALTRIAEIDRALADHLRSSVRTGLRCAYLPDPLSRVAWTLS